MKVSTTLLLSVVSFTTTLTNVYGETLNNCKMVPFATRDGLTGMCCVFYKSTNSESFPKEEVVQQILSQQSGYGESKSSLPHQRTESDDTVVFGNGKRNYNGQDRDTLVTTESYPQDVTQRSNKERSRSRLPYQDRERNDSGRLSMEGGKRNYNGQNRDSLVTTESYPQDFTQRNDEDRSRSRLSHQDKERDDPDRLSLGDRKRNYNDQNTDMLVTTESMPQDFTQQSNEDRNRSNLPHRNAEKNDSDRLSFGDGKRRYNGKPKETHETRMRNGTENKTGNAKVGNVTIETKNAFDVPSGCESGKLKDHRGGCSETWN